MLSFWALFRIFGCQVLTRLRSNGIITMLYSSEWNMSEDNRKVSTSVQRAFQLVECLSRTQRKRILQREDASLPPSTTHRILHTLAWTGMCTRTRRRGLSADETSGHRQPGDVAEACGRSRFASEDSANLPESVRRGMDGDKALTVEALLSGETWSIAGSVSAKRSTARVWASV